MALSEELKEFLKERKLPKSWEDYTHPRKSIGEYYKKSRLHWLSTWKAELHHLVAELTRPPLMEGEKMGQFIAHIDIGTVDHHNYLYFPKEYSTYLIIEN